jgi:Adenine-specific DNA methylase
MRYLGNKESMLADIEAVLHEHKLLGKKLSFFDAFCGSGSVANHFKKYFNLVINDNLTWSVVYSRGRICAPNCKFDLLGFDPFEHLNANEKKLEGFIYNTYAPTKTPRMYFTPDNAGRIDYFRWQIQEWKNMSLLTDDEYFYLLACLIESVSDVSNTAGVYGAFLKKWDSRATKNIHFNKVDVSADLPKSLKTYNSKVEEIIGEVDCDILYLDPPYTQNQYGTQYHLLETLILDDSPEVSKVTGSRSTSPMRSDWSKQFKANILLDTVLAKTKAKYILLSYNNDGFMSKDFIEASMKRYGKPKTFSCKCVAYKKYQNWKSKNASEHFEYIFFIEMKDAKDVFYESPLNYIGSKSQSVQEILEYVPKGITSFYDLFGGGFNVGINATASEIIYNDINYFVKDIIESFNKHTTYNFVSYVNKIINQFGLKAGDTDSYNAVRAYYNKLPHQKRDPRLLFTIIMYGFQQQIRFNGSHDFNNPVGARWFNDKVLEKLISFSRKIKELPCSFFSMNYLDLEPQIRKSIFVYMDPPYQLTNGSYNDGKRGFSGWSSQQENDLFEFADRLNTAGISFMLSYVIEHKGAINKKLLDWIESRNYKLITLNDVIGIAGSRRKEILVINYDV